jgi:hypothetical protein
MATEGLALQRARSVLESALERPVYINPRPAGLSPEPDGEFVLEGIRFLVEVKNDARSGSVARAIEQLQSYRAQDPNAHLMLIVPQMNDVGAELSKRARINWVDLHGNADIDENRLRIKIRGMRDDVAGEYTESSGLNPFSHRASRIVQILLSDPKRLWNRSELQAASHLDKGFVSKIVAELVSQDYIAEESLSGRVRSIRVRKPMVLLDAWAERYRPVQPSSWSLLAVRDGFAAAAKVADIFTNHGVQYALTGLPAAAEYVAFGTFRRVDVYVAKPLPDAVLSELPMESDSRGRNVFVRVDELATLVGPQLRSGRCYASPELVYLDLAALPERAAEAREEMRIFLEALWN